MMKSKQNNLEEVIRKKNDLDRFYSLVKDLNIDPTYINCYEDMFDNEICVRLFDEINQAIEDKMVKDFKEACNLIRENYNIYMSHYQDEFIETPNLWRKIKSDKTFFETLKRKQKIEKIEKSNKSLFD